MATFYGTIFNTRVRPPQVQRDITHVIYCRTIDKTLDNKEDTKKNDAILRIVLTSMFFTKSVLAQILSSSRLHERTRTSTRVLWAFVGQGVIYSRREDMARSWH